ncbi:hypothetical protein [Paenibacillus taichungensis]|uniref:hypothetical protein n=1 Tax=Paenibacillus taichungensis TaxID=484184 RepID=UPI0035D91179
MITDQMNGNSSSNLCRLCIYRYLITGSFFCKVIPLNEECSPMFEYELLGSIIISCPTSQPDTSPSLVTAIPPGFSDIPADIRKRDTILKGFSYDDRKYYADQVRAGRQPDDPIRVPPLRSVPATSLLACEGKWVNLLIGNIFTLTPVVFRFDKLEQDPFGRLGLIGWLELPDGSFKQFPEDNPYLASNIQVIWC